MNVDDDTQGRLGVGDLCTARYNNVGDGMVYRVTGTDVNDVLTLVPVTGVLTQTSGRRVRHLGAGWCTRLTVDDINMAAQRLNELANDELRRTREAGTVAQGRTAGAPAGDARRGPRQVGGAHPVLCEDGTWRREGSH